MAMMAEINRSKQTKNGANHLPSFEHLTRGAKMENAKTIKPIKRLLD